jgi:alpha-beta hydrolase superfamily lysophospholipase
MKQQQGTLDPVRECSIYQQAWLPEDPARAALLLVHGLGEHSGRYANLVDHLVPRGYAVYALDHVGHGRSGGQRMCVELFDDYVQPIQAYVTQIRAEQPGRPLFMLGHSLGGLIAAYTLCQEDGQEALAGAVLSGPAVAIPEGISPLMIQASKILSALLPRAGVVEAVNPEFISRDPQVVQAYRQDPLVTIGRMPARLGAEILRAQQHVAAHAAGISLPVLIVQGEQDRLVPAAGARALYEQIGSPDKTLRVYDGLYHEVFNEPERAQVLTDVETWLADHV